RAQILLLRTLLDCGLPAEAEQHFVSATRLFEAEDIEVGTLRKAWQEMRKVQSAPTLLPSLNARVVEPAAHASVPDLDALSSSSTGPERASLAVMPFAELGRQAGQIQLADGLTNDTISRLAKLRNLFVIARGSVYALAERGIGPEEAARRLNVDY